MVKVRELSPLPLANRLPCRSPVKEGRRSVTRVKPATRIYKEFRELVTPEGYGFDVAQARFFEHSYRRDVVGHRQADGLFQAELGEPVAN